MATPEFAAVFQHLRALLVPYAPHLVVKTESEGLYYLDSAHIQKNKTPLFFGGVQIMKNYVSFHLFPVYICPKMLESLSPELRKRLTGKACFNFKTVDEPVMAELGRLVEAGFHRYQAEGLLS
jgi:hypothetical protein